MKTKIKIVLIVAAIFGMIVAYNLHKDSVLDSYAEENNCSWTVQGSHYICR